MVKKIFYIFLSLIVLIGIYLNIFEFLLYNFHSPTNGKIIHPLAYNSVWTYLLHQKYITLIELDILNIHEKRHLLDVKRVFNTTYILWFFSASLSFLILTVFFKKVIKYVGILGLSLNIFTLILSFNFLNSFELFHTLFFKENSWIFMQNSLLIRWFPLIYFQEFFALFLLLSSPFFVLFIRVTSKSSL
jgi:uncharacterized membrane protein